MTLKTRQYKQSFIKEMSKNEITTTQYKQSVINEMTKNDNKVKTIQTISYH